MKLELRPYQVEAIDRTMAALGRGAMRQLGVAATGLGKTVVFCALAERMNCRTLVLAHRDELIEQAVAKMREVWPEARIGVVKGERNEMWSDVVVASVQTLGRQARLDKMLATGDSLLRPTEPFGLIVVDEAHHTAADSYRRILDGLGAGKPGGPLVLGVTATPDRGDGKGLDDLFDEIAWSYDLLWGIRMGYLCDIRGLAVSVSSLDLSGVKVRRGDYDQGQAGAAMMQAGTPAHIVDAWLAHAMGRRTIVFTPTVAMAEAVAGEFAGNGVKVGFVSGQTPLDERRAVLAAYSRGDIDVIANCAVLTEGYDEPRTDCIVVARPTQSRALYTQMIGRGTRRHPDKADCLVLDVVGGAAEHSLVTIPSLFGIGGSRRTRMGDGSGSLIDTIDEQEQEQVRSGRLRADEVALFHQVRSAGIAWVLSTPDGAPLKRYVRPMGKGQDGTDRGTVVLAQRTDTEWTAGVQHGDGTKRVLLALTSMEMAQGVAEDYVRKVGGGALVSVDAPWRKKKPGPKQRAFAKRLGIPVTKEMTAGDVSDLIDRRKARQA